MRQLVPVISPATTVHDPHPIRPQLPDNYTIEDANADFFGVTPKK